MSLKLGFDIDEVISYMTPAMTRYLKEKWDIDFDFNNVNSISTYAISSMTFINDKEKNSEIITDLLKTVNSPDFQTTSTPIEGALNAIFKWKNLGHEIYYITSRPISIYSYNQTKDWLKCHKFPCDFLYHTGHNIEKGIVAAELKLDFFVEDRIRHVDSLTIHQKEWTKGIAILNKPWNINKKLIDHTLIKITRCENWKEIENHFDSL